MITSHDPSRRPVPLRDAFRSVSGSAAFVGALVVFGASWGLLSIDQATALDGLLAAVPGAVTLITALAASFGLVTRAEPLVTPVISPRDNDGRRLVPVVPEDA